MLRFSHNRNQLGSETLVVLGEKRNRSTSGTGSAGSSNSVDVVLDVTGHIVIDHVGDTFHVYNNDTVSNSVPCLGLKKANDLTCVLCFEMLQQENTVPVTF